MINDFVSVLRNSQVQVHIWHNQTQGPSSFSAHKALEEYYTSIGEHIDELVESVQGIYGIVVDYKPAPSYLNYSSVEEASAYFKTLYDYIQKERANCYQESWIQNQIDEIAQLVASIIFKLTLK